jgi:hypothetical protein
MMPPSPFFQPRFPVNLTVARAWTGIWSFGIHLRHLRRACHALIDAIGWEQDRSVPVSSEHGTFPNT